MGTKAVTDLSSVGVPDALLCGAKLTANRRYVVKVELYPKRLLG